MNLSEKALLIQLNISQWTARKYDRKVTNEVATQNNAIASAGRYNKLLLPMSDLLSNIHKKSSLVYGKYHDNTLPWGIKGTQLLPSANYLAFMTEFRKEKSEWESLVQTFLSNYEQLRDEAQQWMGTLYNPADYPSLDAVRDKFGMELAVFPVPTDDFRVSITDEELLRIQQDVEARVTKAGQDAMKDVWTRLYDKVNWLAERLGDPKNVFRSETYADMADLCALLPRLNFTDDPNLEAMRLEVEAKLAGHHPEALRNDPDIRRDTAQEAAAIMAKMRGFMGAPA